MLTRRSYTSSSILTACVIAGIAGVAPAAAQEHKWENEFHGGGMLPSNRVLRRAS